MPLLMATKMEITNIVDLFHSFSKMKESGMIDALQSIDSCSTPDGSNDCRDTENNVQIDNERTFE